MHKIKVAVEELQKALKKYKDNKGKDKNNKNMISLLRKIDSTEYTFHNCIHDLLREFPEILHRRI